MPKLRIAPRRLSESLWIETDRRKAEAVDLDDLGLSDELADRIEAWLDDFDATYDATEPERSGFVDAAAERRWRAEAEAIAAGLADELDGDWEIELDL